MRKMFDNKDDLVYKIERNQIIPNGYAQKISYRIIKKAWYITFFCQIVVYDILSDIFKQGVNVTICLINIFVTYWMINAIFIDTYVNNKRKIYHVKFIEFYYEILNRDAKQESIVFNEIESGNRKCSFIEFVTYLLKRWLSLFCISSIVGCIFIETDQLFNFTKILIVIIVCLLYIFFSSILFHRVFVKNKMEDKKD